MAIPVKVSAINPGPISFSVGNGWTAYQEYTPDGLVERVTNSKGQQAAPGYDPTETDGWLPVFDAATFGEGWMNGSGAFSSTRPSPDWATWQRRDKEGTFGEAFNPITQKWEPMVEADTEGGTKNNGVMPQSVAQRLFPGGAYTAQNIPFKGGFMDDIGGNLLPIVAGVLSGMAPGLTSALGGGLTGTIAKGALTSALTGGNPISGVVSGLASSGLSSLASSLSGAAPATAAASAPFDTASAAALDPSALAAGGLDPYSTGGIMAALTTPTEASSNPLAQIAQASGTTTDVGGGLFNGVSAGADGLPVLGTVTSSGDVDLAGVGESSYNSLPGNSSYQDLVTQAAANGVSPTTATAAAGAAIPAVMGGANTSSGDPDLTGVGQTSYNSLPGNTQYNTATPSGATGGLQDWLAKFSSDPQGAMKDILTGTGSSGGYTFPLGATIAGLMAYMNNSDVQSQLKALQDKATAAADPFASQRPFYQTELKNMFTDPNYFSNNAVLGGANANAVNDTTRKLAAQGYNMSGNVPMEVGQRLQNNNMTYAKDLMSLTGNLAGGMQGPGFAGNVAANTGTNAINAGTQANGTLGNLFGNILNGSQNTGTGKQNPNLMQFLFG